MKTSRPGTFLELLILTSPGILNEELKEERERERENNAKDKLDKFIIDKIDMSSCCHDVFKDDETVCLLLP